MIKEAIQYFLQPSTRHAKRLGYAYESVAIQSRYERQKEAWLPHVKNCHSFFKKLSGNSIVILGSGALIDIPIEELQKQFEKIYLVDIVHPRKVLKEFKDSQRVECITLDITGLNKILGKKFSEKQILEVLSKTNIEALPKSDVLVSCNLLSQLPLKPVHYIAKNIPSIDQKFLKKKIQRQHIELLKEFSGRPFVISDVELAYRDASNHLANRQDTVHVKIPLENEEVWYWQIAPRGEISYSYSADLKVLAGQIKKS